MEVAIKCFRVHSHTVAMVKKRFIKEALLLHFLPHPNIIPFIGIVMERNKFWIVSPWMENGDITKFVKKFPAISKKELIEQVADGLHFLKQNSVVHGDLKGSNILINSSEKACISDLGLSSLLREDINRPPKPTTATRFASPVNVLQCQMALKAGGLSTTLGLTLSSRMSSFSGAGTYRYMAPERLLPEAYGSSTPKATFESDIFSFAMVIYETYSGNVPFHHLNHYAAFLQVIKGMRPPRPPKIEDEVWEITMECWRVSADARPSICDVYNRLACIP